MRSTYQLSPIPPFRGSSLKYSTATATPSSTRSSSRSISSHCDGLLPFSPAKTEDLDASCSPSPAVAERAPPPSSESSSSLTSFAAIKKRPVPLPSLSLANLYPTDPDGLSAPSPPSPFVYQQLLNQSAGARRPSSPHILPFAIDKDDPKRGSLIPSRFQPGRFHNKPQRVMRTSMGASPHQHIILSSPRAPASLATLQGNFEKNMLEQQVYFASLQQAMTTTKPPGTSATFSYPVPDMHLTPPPTPSSREPPPQLPGANKTVSFTFNRGIPRLPLTPTTSPINKPAPSLSSVTVSAKALSTHKLHELFVANYTLGDELGSGGFGFVVQATRNQDGMQCAVKFIYKDKVPQHAWVKDDLWGDSSDANGVMRTKDGIKRVPLEAYVLKTIRHRGVVAFVDLFEDKSYIYLVMEHHGSPWTASEKENKAITSLPIASAFTSGIPTYRSPLSQPRHSLSLLPANASASKSGGLQMDMNPESRKNSLTPFATPSPMSGMMRRSSCDLFECIEQHSRLPEQYAKYVFAQLIDVVGCLHYNGFVHRDIKDENIVIDDKYRVKLIDFGSTYLFDYRQEPQTLSRFFGTLNFAAPELVKKGSYQPMAAEIWSLGILLTILVTGESFFHDTEAIKNYKASPPSNRISDSCMDLIFRCLALKPEDRWNCFKIRNHPWLADCQWPWSDLPVDACLESSTRVRKRAKVAAEKLLKI